ncbi:MAG: IS4 family transposase [Chloroflexaceae bacterium]|nr:IS4 family transposase [Chloroflexaceae bacterium]
MTTPAPMIPPTPDMRPTTPEMLFPIFGACFSRPILQQWIKQAHLPHRLYWRVFTPLLTLWCLVVQRIMTDHTLDAVVSHVQTGAADQIDPQAIPVSARLTSERTSSFSQARKRMPLALVQWALRLISHVIADSLPADQQTWHGHRVRLLDGTTFRALATDDLDQAYGRSANQQGWTAWITVRSVASFCLFNQMVIGYTEGSETTSEQAMVRTVMEQDTTGALYVGDAHFGIYWVAQVTQALGHQLIARLQASRFHALRRTVVGPSPCTSGQDWEVTWTPSRDGKIDPTLPADPVTGRLLAIRLEKKGFRPKDLYLFTTLRDATAYPVAEIAALYGKRWQVERDYRHIKTVLEMDTFAVQSAALLRLELAAGLLTYNMVCGLIAQAAQQADLRPQQLSFARCWRRIRDTLCGGVPSWVSDPQTHVLQRLAHCRLHHQPWKVAHEPRNVRHQRQKYPTLRGDRDARGRKYCTRWARWILRRSTIQQGMIRRQLSLLQQPTHRMKHPRKNHDWRCPEAT